MSTPIAPIPTTSFAISSSSSSLPSPADAYEAGEFRRVRRRVYPNLVWTRPKEAKPDEVKPIIKQETGAGAGAGADRQSTKGHSRSAEPQRQQRDLLLRQAAWATVGPLESTTLR